MKKTDVAVIGGGLLGCFAARELMRYDLSAVLVEKAEDVCSGISKANTAIVYPGYDHKPGTFKQSLTLKANAGFDTLCRELEVPFVRCGSLMLSFGPKADEVIRYKYENGRSCGVPGLELLSGSEARALEPCISETVCSALWAPSAGTTDPWQLCYAAFENAMANGCGYSPNSALLSVRRENGGYLLETEGGEFFARAVINCAGMNADRVHEMLFAPSVRILPRGADYLLLERGSASLRHIIQHESEAGKGVTAVPTVGGSIILGPTEREYGTSPSEVAAEGLETIHTLSAQVLPGLKSGNVIRSFASARPMVCRVVLKNGEIVPDKKNIGSFAIETPEPGYLGFIGIKTPGLTCAKELGAFAAERAAQYLGAGKRGDFTPERKAPLRAKDLPFEKRTQLIAENPDYGEIICRCEEISEAEVLEAIRRGAVTVDGVKRRCGAMLGVCQGSRCLMRILELLARERNIPLESVTMSGGNSFVAEARREKS